MEIHGIFEAESIVFVSIQIWKRGGKTKGRAQVWRYIGHGCIASCDGYNYMRHMDHSVV